MINDLKLGMKMLRYGDHMILQMVAMAVTWFLGLIMNVSIKYVSISLSGQIQLIQIPIGAVFMVIAFMFPAQILYSLSVSNLVQSSPAKKRMQTAIPAAVTFAGMMGNYLVSLVINLIFMAGHPERVGAICGETLLEAVLAAFLMIVLGVAYKFFWTAFLSGLMVFFCTRYGMETLWRVDLSGGGAYALTAAAGFVLILLGGLGQYGLSLLFYKVPMSKYAQSANLRKQM